MIVMDTDIELTDGKWWISTYRWTCLCEIEKGRVKHAAPILGKFIGQTPENLLKWARALGGLKVERM